VCGMFSQASLPRSCAWWCSLELATAGYWRHVSRNVCVDTGSSSACLRSHHGDVSSVQSSITAKPYHSKCTALAVSPTGLQQNRSDVAVVPYTE
jgi:hypothetical protein